MTLTPEDLAKIETRVKNAMSDLIPSSRDDISALIAALKEAWADNERWREAAKPFAELGEVFVKQDPLDDNVWTQTPNDMKIQIGASKQHGWEVSVDDLRRIAALAGEKS